VSYCGDRSRSNVFTVPSAIAYAARTKIHRFRPSRPAPRMSVSEPQSRNVRSWRIPLKNSAVQRYGPVSRVFDGPSKTTILQRVPRLGPGYAAIISIRALAGLNLASRRKFCAVAARRNSSLAPHGPRSRKRPTRRMRLRWANSISTFFRRRQAVSYSGVDARARATSRAFSFRSRGILRAAAFGQQRDLRSQTSQSLLLAR
jgi:hypothetical protein